MYMKSCTECKSIKSLSEFYTNKAAKDGHTARCKSCLKEADKKYYSKNASKIKSRVRRYAEYNPIPIMINSARARAKKQGVPFSITADDISIPNNCPIFNIPLKKQKSELKINSPSLDRLVPEKGYVKGNIIVVSNKANMIKNAFSADDIMKVALFYKNLPADN